MKKSPEASELAGVAAGGVLVYLIIRLLELRNVGFILSPDLAEWAYVAGLTALYSIVIYSIALRKVRKLKHTDIA